MRRKNMVGDAGDLGHFGDVMDADDVRTSENAGRDRGGGAPDALIGWRGLGGVGKPFLRQGKCGA